MAEIAISIANLDGTYRVEYHDIHAIYAANRERDMHAAKPPERQKRTGEPVLGFVSKTLIHSPAVNWICRARIRAKVKNDIVLVGEDRLDLVTVLREGNLSHVGTKAYHGRTIKAAATLGEATKYFEPDLIKPEDDDMVMSGGASSPMPPQMVVLALDTAELVFVFACDEFPGAITFRESFYPLPRIDSVLRTVGARLAIDPMSRAIAVAAHDRGIVLLCLNRKQLLGCDVPPVSARWSPVMADLPLQVDGTILQMEFLYPKREEEHDSLVRLAVIVAKGGKSRIICYTWDDADISDFTPGAVKVSQQPLAKHHRFPHLMIPLQHAPKFWLLYDNGMRILIHNPFTNERIPTEQSDPQEQPIHYALSPKLPVYTAWARTLRNADWHEGRGEAYYIAREDGAIHYLHFDNMWKLDKAGHMKCHLNTAFACFGPDVRLNGHLTGPDILIGSGESSTGEVTRIGLLAGVPLNDISGSRADAHRLHTVEFISNWTPLTDVTIANFETSNNATISKRDRLFATAHAEPYGGIVELRKGIEACVAYVIKPEFQSTSTKIFAFRDPYGKATPIPLLVLPDGTVPVYIEQENSQPHTRSDSDDCGIDQDGQTLAAASLPYGRSLQVTENAIHLLGSATAHSMFPESRASELAAGSIIVLAAVSTDLHLLLTVVSSSEGFRLHGAIIESEVNSFLLEQISQPLSLEYDPTCIGIFRVETSAIITIGAADGALHVYEIRPDHIFVHLLTHRFPATSEDSSPVCESTVLLTNRSAYNNSPDLVLLCGLRDGGVQCLELEVTTDQKDGIILGLGKPTMHCLGLTSVKLVANNENTSSTAFAICDSTISRLDLEGGHEIGPTISSVWFTDRADPLYEQPPISDMTWLPAKDNSPDMLICVAEGCVLLASLDAHPTVVPRYLPVEGAPSRVLYSQRFDCVIAGSIKTNLVPSGIPHHAWQGERRRRAQLQFVHAQEIPTQDGEKDLPICIEDGRGSSGTGHVLQLRAGERIMAILDWSCQTEAGSKRDFLVVGTELVEGPDRRLGRALFLQVKEEDGGLYKFKTIKIQKFKDPVYALAAFRPNELLISHGNRLELDRVIFESEPQRPRWQSVCQVELYSPGIQVTTSAPYIYVSTAEHSFLTYEYRSTSTSPGSPDESLSLLFSDSVVRYTTCHLALQLPASVLQQQANSVEHAPTIGHSVSSALDTPNLVLVADKTKRLVGLTHPLADRHQQVTSTLFEAHLSKSVMRLKQAAIRPPWRQKKVQGVLVDDIIGTCTNGRMFQFSIVAAEIWHLLKFAENLCRWADEMAMLDLSDGSTVGVVIDPDRDTANSRISKTAYHVDGDILDRLLKVGGRKELKRMLELALPDSERVEGEADFNPPPEERIERFMALAGAVLGPEHEGMEESIEGVVVWMRDVLASML